MPKQKKLLPAEIEKHLVRRGLSSFAVIGCKGTGSSYPCCEYDILADLKDSIILHEIAGSTFVDLVPIPAKPDETDSFNFLHMNTVADPNLILSGLSKNSKKIIADDYALSRLLEAISAIKKAEGCFDEKNSVDASFWVYTAGYELAESAIAYSQSSFHPTHLLDDVKFVFPKIGAQQEVFSDAINLQVTSRTSVDRRLEGINELMLASLQLLEGSPESVFVYSKQLNKKISWLLKNHAVLQAHAFLGWQTITMLRSIYSKFCKDMGIPPHHNRIVTELLERGERPYRISQESLRLMGIQNDSNIPSIVRNLRELTESVRKAVASGRL